MEWAFIVFSTVPIIVLISAISAAKNMIAYAYCYIVCCKKIRLMLVDAENGVCTYTDGEYTFKVQEIRTRKQSYIDARTNGSLLWFENDKWILLRFIVFFAVFSQVCANMVIDLIRAYIQYKS